MKTKSLFEHIKHITNVQSPTYWEDITDADKKTWSNYMVHRFLSMKQEWLVLVNEIQRYWELKPKTIYQFYTDVLPRGNTFLRYTKAKKKSKIEKWAMDILCDYFEESSENIEKTLDIMGKDVVNSIISKYGVDDKQMKKIWSK
tara:strand:- start:70 stop:501 length:432 start_codon:yes stop_codon:yes gene_type:complete